MTGWVRDSRNARCILAALFALVLAIRVAIPTGYMPTAAPSGIVISVCTGMGEAKAFLPIEKDGDQDKHSTAEGPCTFAAGLGGGLVPSSLADLKPVALLPSSPAISRRIADLTVHRLAAPPPPAIGPPARA